MKIGAKECVDMLVNFFQNREDIISEYLGKNVGD